MFAVTLLAASLTAPVPKAKAPNYFPLTVGNKWVYDQDGKEVSEEVTKVIADGKQTRVIVTCTDGPGNSWEMEYIVADGAVSQPKNGLLTYDPPFRRVDLDLKPGAKWESVTLSVKGSFVCSGEMVAGEEEEVKVPAGTFKAVPVVYTVTKVDGKRLKPKPLVYTDWYAEGVGLVKAKYPHPDGDKTLKSFTPGKDDKK